MPTFKRVTLCFYKQTKFTHFHKIRKKYTSNISIILILEQVNPARMSILCMYKLLKLCAWNAVRNYQSASVSGSRKRARSHLSSLCEQRLVWIAPSTMNVHVRGSWTRAGQGTYKVTFKPTEKDLTTAGGAGAKYNVHSTIRPFSPKVTCKQTCRQRTPFVLSSRR